MAKVVDFWAEYADCARKSGVPEAQIQWFLRWVERFSRHLRGVPLRERSVSDVTDFLDDLKADERIAPWQIEQARQALRILYRDVFGLNRKTMAPERGHGLRDTVAQPRQLEAVHGKLLQELAASIRMHHYSPRTEEAYLGWVKRFIAFHELRPPSDLNASDIKELLELPCCRKGGFVKHAESGAQRDRLSLHGGDETRSGGFFGLHAREDAKAQTGYALARTGDRAD